MNTNNYLLKNKNFQALAASISGAIVVFLFVLCCDKIIVTSDVIVHYRWITQISSALQEGTIYPRWLPLANLGLGELLYSPYLGYWYLSGILEILGLDAWQAIKLLAFFSIIMMGLVSYYFASLVVSQRTALITILMLQFAPYPFYLFTRNSAFPWHFSLPLALLLIGLTLELEQSKLQSRIAIVFTVAFLILSHVLVAFMTLICLTPIAIYLIQQTQFSGNRKNVIIIMNWILPVAIGIGLVSFHLLPAIAARNLVDPISSSDPIWYNWKNSFAFPIITYSIWGLRWFAMQWILPGIVLFSMIVTIIIAYQLLDKKDNLRKYIFSLIGLTAVALILASEISYPLYALIPPLRSIQWPYRFISIASLSGTFALALCSQPIYKQYKKKYILTAIYLLGIACNFIPFITLQVELLREGRNPNLSPELLQKEFHQTGLEFATMGLNWREYVLNGGFLGECRKNKIECNVLVDKSQFKKWQIKTVEQINLNLPVFDFPGWYVSIDGNEATHMTDLQTGLVSVSVPSGQHNIVLDMKGLTQEYTGRIISLGAVTAFIILCVLSVSLSRVEQNIDKKVNGVSSKNEI